MRFSTNAALFRCGAHTILSTSANGDEYRVEYAGSTVRLHLIRRRSTRSGGGQPRPVIVARWKVDAIRTRQQARERTNRAVVRARRRNDIRVDVGDIHPRRTREDTETHNVQSLAERANAMVEENEVSGSAADRFDDIDDGAHAPVACESPAITVGRGNPQDSPCDAADVDACTQSSRAACRPPPLEIVEQGCASICVASSTGSADANMLSQDDCGTGGTGHNAQIPTNAHNDIGFWRRMSNVLSGYLASASTQRHRENGLQPQFAVNDKGEIDFVLSAALCPRPRHPSA